MSKPIKIEQHSGLGMIWFIGWLFSVGFLQLGFWKGLLALFVWPYFIGAHVSEHLQAAPSYNSEQTIEQAQGARP